MNGNKINSVFANDANDRVRMNEFARNYNDPSVYGIWDKMARENKLIGPDYDYSLGGAVDNNGHMTDMGKLPNHPTYSQESWFSKNTDKKGGSWMQDKNGRWIFAPQEWQVNNPEGLDNLLRYFGREKGRGIDEILLPNGEVIR